MKPVLETKSTYKGYQYVVLFMPGHTDVDTLEYLTATS